jgi:hypothetical protein
MIISNIWKNRKCMKPPTRIDEVQKMVSIKTSISSKCPMLEARMATATGFCWVLNSCMTTHWER